MLKISNNYNLNNYKISDLYKRSVSFGSNYTITRDIFNSPVTKNATFFFRGDLKRKDFCNLILSFLRKGEKLNIVCAGCSDGSEPTSLLISLMESDLFRNNLQKFDGIKAYDIDDKQLSIAKSGKIPIIIDPYTGINDFLSLFFYAKNSFGKLFTIKQGYLELAKELQEKIKYENKDIVNVVENLPKDEKIVLMARNVLPYLDYYTQIPQLMAGISKLKKGSILAIGDFDKEQIRNIDELIMQQGYKKASINNCFIKD